MRRRLPVSKWFYDNEGYYNYVLLNCTEETFQKVVDALESAGIEVLKAAPSFRPANSGYQYDWYIRIGGDPSYYDILPIVEGVLFETGLQLQVKQLQGQVERKNREIEQLSNELAQVQRLVKLLRTQLQSTKSNLDESHRQIEELNRQIATFTSPAELKTIHEEYRNRLNEKNKQLKSVQEELAKSEAEIERLNDAIVSSYKPEDIDVLRSQYDRRLEERDKQLRVMKAKIEDRQLEIDKLHEQILKLFKPEDIERIRAQYQQQLKEKDEQIAKAKNELQEFLDQFEINEEEIAKRDKMIVDLKNQIAMLEQEKQDLEIEQEAVFSEGHDLSNSENDLGATFYAIVEVLLPDIEFMKGSLRFLWTELPNDVIIDVLSSLQSLDKLKAKRVGGADSWREYYKKNNTYPWRLYFRKCTQKKKCDDGKKYLALISDKNSQSKDIKNRLD